MTCPVRLPPPGNLIRKDDATGARINHATVEGRGATRAAHWRTSAHAAPGMDGRLPFRGKETTDNRDDRQPLQRGRGGGRSADDLGGGSGARRGAVSGAGGGGVLRRELRRLRLRRRSAAPQRLAGRRPPGRSPSPRRMVASAGVAGAVAGSAGCAAADVAQRTGTNLPKLPARIAKSVPLTAPSLLKSAVSHVRLVLPKLPARIEKSVPFTRPSRLASPGRVTLTVRMPSTPAGTGLPKLSSTLLASMRTV